MQNLRTFARCTGWLMAGVLLCAWEAQAQSKAAQDAVKAQQKPPAAPVAQAAPKMPTAPGVPVDRVVAIVNNDLILDSDVDEERRFEAFQPYRENAGEYSRDRAIERLINRALILQQAKLTPLEPLTDEDVRREVDDLRKNIPACKEYDCRTDAGWTKFLKAQGFTQAEFNARWKERMQVLEFIEQRFKQGVRITDKEIRAYYDAKLVPQFTKQNANVPKFEDVSSRIQEVLLEQQVSNLLTDWLKSLRAQGSVVVMHPGEAAP